MLYAQVTWSEFSGPKPLTQRKASGENLAPYCSKSSKVNTPTSSSLCLSIRKLMRSDPNCASIVEKIERDNLSTIIALFASNFTSFTDKTKVDVVLTPVRSLKQVGWFANCYVLSIPVTYDIS